MHGISTLHYRVITLNLRGLIGGWPRHFAGTSLASRESPGTCLAALARPGVPVPPNRGRRRQCCPEWESSRRIRG